MASPSITGNIFKLREHPKYYILPIFAKLVKRTRLMTVPNGKNIYNKLRLQDNPQPSFYFIEEGSTTRWKWANYFIVKLKVQSKPTGNSAYNQFLTFYTDVVRNEL